MVTYEEHEDRLPVLRVAGDEDRSTAGRRRRSLSCALRSRSDVVVDLADCHFADPSLMVDFVVLARRLGMQGRRLRLCRPQPQIRRLIELVGLHRLDTVAVDTPDAGRAAPSPPS